MEVCPTGAQPAANLEREAPRSAHGGRSPANKPIIWLHPAELWSLQLSLPRMPGRGGTRMRVAPTDGEVLRSRGRSENDPTQINHWESDRDGGLADLRPIGGWTEWTPRTFENRLKKYGFPRCYNP